MDLSDAIDNELERRRVLEEIAKHGFTHLGISQANIISTSACCGSFLYEPDEGAPLRCGKCGHICEDS